MWWPFGKKEDRQLEDLQKSVENSFSNVRKDFELLSESIKNLEGKKDEHHSKITIILDRLTKLEKDLDIPDQEVGGNFEIQPAKTNIEFFESLTDKQKTFCQVLAALNKETPNKWISLKALASELHPNSSYNAIRSTLSEYTSLLEELGYLKKRRKGNQAFVMTSTTNPFYQKPEAIKVIKETSIPQNKSKNKKSKR